MINVTSNELNFSEFSAEFLVNGIGDCSITSDRKTDVSRKSTSINEAYKYDSERLQNERNDWITLQTVFLSLLNHFLRNP